MRLHLFLRRRRAAAAAPAPARGPYTRPSQPSTGGAAADATFDLTPDLPSFTSGVYEFRVRVDHTVDAYIEGDSLTFFVLAGNTILNPVVEPNQSLPRSPLSSVKVNLRQGRGSAKIIERPSADNNYALRIRLTDPGRAAADYHVQVEWRK